MDIVQSHGNNIYITNNWSEENVRNSIGYAHLINANFDKVFCYGPNRKEEIIRWVLDWPRGGRWAINGEFLQELVKNNIITIKREDEILLFKNDETRRDIRNTI